MFHKVQHFFSTREAQHPPPVLTRICPSTGRFTVTVVPLTVPLVVTLANGVVTETVLLATVTLVPFRGPATETVRLPPLLSTSTFCSTLRRPGAGASVSKSNCSPIGYQAKRCNPHRLCSEVVLAAGACHWHQHPDRQTASDRAPRQTDSIQAGWPVHGLVMYASVTGWGHGSPWSWHYQSAALQIHVPSAVPCDSSTCGKVKA
jgi:hypothetical protein